MLFDDGQTIFFSASWIDCRFIDDNASFAYGFSHGFAGFDEGGEIGTVVFIDRGGDGDDEDVGGFEKVWISGKHESGCGMRDTGCRIRDVGSGNGKIG